MTKGLFYGIFYNKLFEVSNLQASLAYINNMNTYERFEIESSSKVKILQIKLIYYVVVGPLRPLSFPTLPPPCPWARNTRMTDRPGAVASG